MSPRARRRAAGSRRALKEAGRVDILQAAAGLLATHGYHGMSMRDLAATTDMSLANLYNYFASKEDLLFALQTRAFETLIGMAEEVVAHPRRPEAKLHAFILSHVRYVASHRDIMRVLVEEAGELPPERRRAVRTLKERYFQVGRALVRGVIAPRGGKHPRRAADGAELDRATYNVFGMLNWVYAWYSPERHDTPPVVARTILRMSLVGVGGSGPARAALSATERHVEGTAVRSPIHLRPSD